MLSIFNGVRDITMLSVTVRLCLAVLCGGMIGLERAFKRRPAGFRTHILICLGASLTTMTSQYLYLNMHYFTDMARLGAQVVAGIGFIGAGTIIVTRRQRLNSLTTAAGIWTRANVGLALGGGSWPSWCSRASSTAFWTTCPRSTCTWSIRIRTAWRTCSSSCARTA